MASVTAVPSSSANAPSLKAADLVIELSQTHKAKPDLTNLVFGTVFSDHMLTIEWTNAGGWQKPPIKPFGNLSLHSACSAMHYTVQCLLQSLNVLFVHIFVPFLLSWLNLSFVLSPSPPSLLHAFDRAELGECIRRLVQVDLEWVPQSDSASLYIRPTFLGTERPLGVTKSSHALLYVILSPVGSFFSTGAKPVSLWADSKYIRAWRGGTGDYKMGGNYGASIYAQHEAVDCGCQQVLWLYGDDHQVTEVGTMNIFLFWNNEKGEEELATPPLNGIILPGITRQSILELTRKWGEFKVCERYLTMADLRWALKEGRVKEMFGSGTACVVSPVGRILYQGENLHIPCQEDFPQPASRLMKELTDIQVRWSQTSIQRLFHVGSTSFNSTSVCPVRHL
ncbi:branched-chain-amino-acid aminotransferase, cytosolic-like [Salvelinus fontinalis]|uniref:branched-chain-amino-acid aminotransferase, cytosolic-like n=1 Tax=Salvelinus fontinalis TaxID=8038 RepID=UPI002486C2BB|nr:branched-chain-amino-acid aminotransferase, cytosolic-like [Salvelinus fontinalis]